MNPPLETRARQAAEQLDAHVRDIINWHFSPETGCPFWLDAKHAPPGTSATVSWRVPSGASTVPSTGASVVNG